MALCRELVAAEFPLMDDDLSEYVVGVLGQGEDFESGEELYEAIGEVLVEASSKSESDVRDICERLLGATRDSTAPPTRGRGREERRALDAPRTLACDPAPPVAPAPIPPVVPAGATKVDARKLERAEERLRQKRERTARGPGEPGLGPGRASELEATASQATSKKDARSASDRDVRLENFDVAFGERTLLSGADLCLAQGRRYGLVGRNGLGKTTLLRMLAGGHLRTPPHLTVLHVEQEVVGDDTLALDSVLQCDEVREALLRRERELTAAGPAAAAELAEVYERLQGIEADRAPARASKILRGLGFSAEAQRRPTSSFSGGWRMRLALARALFSEPDLLLLDEPTNMLDVKAIVWLENHLQGWPTTLLVVSHDRNFLDAVPTDILHLHSQTLDAYRGNYEQFDRTRTERSKNRRREYEAQAQQRAHVQEFIDRFRYNANRASSVQSKIKMLERLPELRPAEKETEVTLRFPEIAPLSPPILQLDGVSFRYAPDLPVFEDVNLGATLESRICIVGENGAGKTTLLKIIMGILAPTAGVRHVHRNLKFGYFSQHHVDQLDMDVDSVELLRRSHPGKSAEEYRRQLGAFGVCGDLALQRVGSLSGGQKSRVVFSRMCMGTPNFLVLDEPTNHLDIETIEALGAAINAYNGGVVLVSHDERLIRAVCRELWVCGRGTVGTLEGGFDEYRRAVEAELQEAQAK